MLIVTNQTPDYFEVDRGDGTPIRIARLGLSEEMLQKFQYGGVARSMAMNTQEMLQSLPDEEIAAAEQEKANFIDQQMREQEQARKQADLETQRFSSMATPEELGSIPSVGVPDAIALPLEEQPPDMQTPVFDRFPVPKVATPEVPPAAIPPAPQPAQKPSPKVSPRLSSVPAPRPPTPPQIGPPEPSLIDQYMVAQRQQIEAQKDVEKEEAAAVEQIEVQRQKRLLDAGTEWEERRKQAQDHQREIRGLISSGKIDPNRLWNRMGTGNQVLSGLSMIISGIASGVARGTRVDPQARNLALDLFENAVDRDIQAQRDNVGMLKDLYGFYQDETKDADSAFKLVKADALDIAASQLNQLAASTGPKRAQVNAEKASADLALRAQDLRDTVSKRALEMRKLAIEAEAAAARANYYNARASKASAPVVPKPDAPVTTQELLRQFQLQEKIEEYEEKKRAKEARLRIEMGQGSVSDMNELDQKDRERAVTLQTPDGPVIRFTSSKQDADAVKSALTGVQKIRSSIRNAEKIYKDKEEGKGYAGPWDRFFGSSHDEGAAIKARITGAIKEAETLGALDNGVERLVAPIAKNPTEIFLDRNFDAWVKTVTSYTNSLEEAILKSRVLQQPEERKATFSR